LLLLSDKYTGKRKKYEITAIELCMLNIFNKNWTPTIPLNLYLGIIDYSTEWNSITVVTLISGEWEAG